MQIFKVYQKNMSDTVVPHLTLNYFIYTNFKNNSFFALASDLTVSAFFEVVWGIYILAQAFVCFCIH